MDPTLALTSLAGAGAGAGIKILVGLLKANQIAKDAQHQKDLVMADKKVEAYIKLREQGPNPDSRFVSWTRRVLAWMLAFTFCVVVILFSVFPTVPVAIPDGIREFTVGLFLWDWQGTRDTLAVVSTGSLVWEMIPFMTMILSMYFVPDISKR